LRGGELAVVAFWSDAALLSSFGEPAQPTQVIDAIGALDAAGLTNISFPLEVALDQLSTASATEQRVLLLSDCVHNAGPDPAGAASRLPRLDVLFDVSGERDSNLASRVARHGRGVVHPIQSYRDIAPALVSILDTELV